MRNRYVSRTVYLVVFLILFNVFSAMVGYRGAAVFIAPILAGFSTIGISYAVRGYLLRRNG